MNICVQSCVIFTKTIVGRSLCFRLWCIPDVDSFFFGVVFLFEHLYCAGIFDKFETSISGDGKYFMTGSYNSAFHIYDSGGLSDTRIESSRAPPPMNQCMMGECMFRPVSSCFVLFQGCCVVCAGCGCLERRCLPRCLKC